MTCDITILSTGEVSLSEDKESLLLKKIDENKKEIDRLWSQSVQTHGGSLFNAPLCFFSGLVEQEPHDSLRVVRGEYKDYMAQQNGLGMGLVPVGVSGVLTSLFRGKVYCILARRARSVTQYPGALELVPSGGLNEDAFTCKGEIQPLRVLLHEFEEELGLSRDTVNTVKSLGVIKDCAQGVVDIGFLLCSFITPSELESAMGSSTEYNEPLFVPFSEVFPMLEAMPRGSVVPTSIALAKMVHDLPLDAYYNNIRR